MDEEIDVVRAGVETVAALTEASGALEPVQTFWAAMARRIDYYFLPRTVAMAKKAAQRIKESGVPTCTYEVLRERDPVLGAILLEGSIESDESMQDRWANLLANALTEGKANV